MKILYFGIYITKDEINKDVQKSFELSLSDPSHLIFKPINNTAIVAFKMSTFTEIDPEKLWDNIHSIVQEKYPQYDSINVAIFVDQFLKFDKDVRNYVASINTLYEDLSNIYIKFDSEISEQYLDLQQSGMFKELQMKKKEPKLPKVPKDILNFDKSKVWSLFTEDQKKTMFGHRGYLITNNEKAVAKDIEIIRKFMNEFIPDNSKFAKKFKEELIARWVAVYVKYVD